MCVSSRTRYAECGHDANNIVQESICEYGQVMLDAMIELGGPTAQLEQTVRAEMPDMDQGCRDRSIVRRYFAPGLCTDCEKRASKARKKEQDKKDRKDADKKEKRKGHKEGTVKIESVR